MANKKNLDFTTAGAQRVQETIEAATAAPEAPEEIKTRKPRREPTPEEAAKALYDMRTRGVKGCKLSRINMAFSPDLYDYIKTMSRVRGQTITDFVNDIVRNNMDDNTEIYEKAKAFRDSF